MSQLPDDPDRLRAHLQHEASTLGPAVQAGGAPEDLVARWLTGTWLTGDPGPTVTAATTLGANTPYAEPGASPAGASAALAFLAGVAQALPSLPNPDAWRDRVDDATADATGRPGAWSDLSELAWTLQAVVDTPSETTTALLDAVGEAALRDQGVEAQHDARASLTAARRAVWLDGWRAWAAEASEALVSPLRDALESLATQPQPMAAAGATAPALARVRLYETPDAELTVAVLPGQVVLEYAGSDTAPTEALVDGTALPAASVTTAADACWQLDAPPPSGATIELKGDGRVIRLAWP